jgi:Trypsin-like peptidase domain/Effector-associated domain 1
MPWNEKLTALNYVLGDLYPFREEAVRIVRVVGLEPSFIQFTSRAIDDWHSILVEADKQNKVLGLVQAALSDYPDNPILIQAQKAETAQLPGLTTLAAPLLDSDLPWKAADLTPTNIEKIMGKQSALLPIAFLEMGLQRARAVARIRRSTGELGSGFLTTGNLLVTNHHVLENPQQSAQATIQFNYQQTAAGLDSEPVVFELDPVSRFATSAEDDWTLVRVKGDANADWGAIEVAPIDVSKTERVNIIQHPSGGPKQIALYHNIVTFVDEKRVQYLTDTLPGSSGSPVFDYQWRIVALHHSGGWIVEPGTKQRVFRNEGININLVERALAQTRLL